MASLTLYWHQYVLDDQALPDELFGLLMDRVYASNGRILWDRAYNKDIIVSIYDDDPWQSIFNVQYSDYMVSSSPHEKTYTW